MAVKFDAILNKLREDDADLTTLDSRYVNVTGDTMTGNLIVSYSTAGENYVMISNSLNGNAAANSTLYMFTQSATAGDPFINFRIVGVQDYSMGIDNSASDVLKITTASDLSSGSIFELSTAGQLYLPSGLLDLGDLSLDTTSTTHLEISGGGLVAGGNITTSASVNGSNLEIAVDNTSATAGSDADLSLTTASGGGDPFIYFDSGSAFALGIDNSDSDLFKLSAGGIIGTGDALIIDASGNHRMAGYLRVGSTSAPSNTTAGDITGVRLKIGDGAFGTGVDASITGDGAFSGFLRVGSETAPANTTAGDLTVLRQRIGDNSAFGNGSGWILGLTGTLTDTGSGAARAIYYNPIFTPASNSSASFVALAFDGVWNPGTGITQTSITAINGQTRIRGDGLVSTIVAINGTGMVLDSGSAATAQATTVQSYIATVYGRPSGTSTATITTGVGYDTTLASNAGLTATTLIGFRMQNPGANTITTLIGLDVASLTRGATNIGVRIGLPSGGATANYALQLSDTGGTAAGGITFGTDVQLYRSAANTLTLDDQLSIAHSAAANLLTITPGTGVGSGDTTSGALFILNTSNGQRAINVYTNTGSGQTTPLMSLFSDSTLMSRSVLDIRQDGSGANGAAVFIDNNGNGNSYEVDHDGNSASKIWGQKITVDNAGAGGVGGIDMSSFSVDEALIKAPDDAITNPGTLTKQIAVDIGGTVYYLYAYTTGT